MRLDYQILLKSPSLTLLAGSALGHKCISLFQFKYKKLGYFREQLPSLDASSV